MEKLRIIINPDNFPGKTAEQIQQLVENAEIIVCKGLDPIGTSIGDIRLLIPVKTPVVNHLTPGVTVNRPESSAEFPRA